LTRIFKFAAVCIESAGKVIVEESPAALLSGIEELMIPLEPIIPLPVVPPEIVPVIAELLLEQIDDGVAETPE
jgi:hypothetical protein